MSRPMGVPLTPRALELLRGPNFAMLATVMADGSPQVTPVWVDTDGTHVRVNAAAGRVKVRNMRRDPRVAIAVLDANDPYSFVSIRGRVVQIAQEGGREHINELSAKYTDTPVYAGPAEETRLKVLIEPLKIHD